MLIQEVQDRTYFIMDHCETAYHEGRFQDIDNELLRLDVDNFDTFECSAWSLCAWWGFNKLNNYYIFVQKCLKRAVQLTDEEKARRIVRVPLTPVSFP